MNISLLKIPWDSGYYDRRMGRGPNHLVDQGLNEYLKAGGNSIELSELKLPNNFITEVNAAKELNILLSQEIQNSRTQDRFPIVLAGNCNTTIGTITGLELDSVGVIWFDAHADFNTPETTHSGFFDGMGLSILTGNSWKQWRKTIPGFTPVNEQNILLIGARDFDPEEEKLLSSSAVTLIGASDIRNQQEEAFHKPLESLSQKCRDIYIHIDLDVFDPVQLKANGFFVDGGLLLSEVQEILKKIRADFDVRALSFASYDPTYDPDNQGFEIVKSIINTIIS